MERVHIVAMIESEAGYGSKIDEKLYFKSEELALRYVKEYNKNIIIALPFQVGIFWLSIMGVQ